MFSPEQIYDYLRYYCYHNKKNVEVLHFLTNGSKLLSDLSVAKTPYVDDEKQQHTIQDPHYIRSTGGCISMFDQEPIDIDAYYHDSYKELLNKDANDYRLSFSNEDFVFSKSLGLYNPIICHSEKNSNSVKQFKNNFHIPVHFWSNAITSIFWFTKYKLLEQVKTKKPYRFGAYIRATDGTRTYRSKLLDEIKNTNIFCPMLINKDINVDSSQSANIDWFDHNKFDIHIVPETLFDTEKTHLTEKVFKPIVMYQTFILFAGPYSLKYMKDYGFKTFSSLWDESYDNIIDNEKRFKAVVDLINHLNSLEEKEYNSLIKKADEIVEHNRRHFFSEIFQNRLINELITSLDKALVVRENTFHEMPGGTLFYYADKYYQEHKKLPTSKTFNVSRKLALEHAYKINSKTGDLIAKYYKHLL